MIEPSLLLTHFIRDCQSKGVTVIQKEVQDFDSLFALHDIVLNCSGLGAKKLVVDPELKPARGVTVRLAAPWVKQFVIANDMPDHPENELAHIFPRLNVAVVGGVKEIGNENPNTSKEEVQK